MEQRLLPLRKRPDFLSARNGEKRRGALFLLEVKHRTHDKTALVQENKDSSVKKDFDTPRIGLTVTRKNGNAVCRNRIKRRLRAAIRVGEIAKIAAPNTDYVIIARKEILETPFTRLVCELRKRVARKSEHKSSHKMQNKFHSEHKPNI